MSEREDFWREYYQQVAAEKRGWLDFSNERVQSQHFALALDAAGAIQGRKSLDIGCGWGQVAQALLGLGAAEVTGVDLIEELIQSNRARNSSIKWMCGSLSDPGFDRQLGEYDLVFLIEVLQYLPLGQTLQQLWKRLAPGGRLIGVVPHGDCPIVRRTMERFHHQFLAPTVADLTGALESLDQMDVWSIRGAAFDSDQRISPYAVYAWGEPVPDGRPIPNRLNFVAIKQALPPQAQNAG